MKLVLFSGDHPRHLFVNRELLKHFDETLVIVMQREEVLPKPPDDLSSMTRDYLKFILKIVKKLKMKLMVLYLLNKFSIKVIQYL